MCSMGIMRSEVNADDLELLEEETLQNRKEQLRERSGAGKDQNDEIAARFFKRLISLEKRLTRQLHF